MREKARAEKRPPRYDGRWRDRDPSEAPAGASYVIRLKAPLDGEKPDAVFRGGIGNVRFEQLSGVAWDGKRLYLADRGANRVHAWKGIPAADADPDVTFVTASSSNNVIEAQPVP